MTLMSRRNLRVWHFAMQNVPRTVSCYMLLMFIIHWDQYKVFWWANPPPPPQQQQQQQAWPVAAERSAVDEDGIPAAGSEHLFIYSSFLYNRRPPANASGTVRVQLVVLFLAHKFHRTTDGMLCVVAKSAISVQKMRPEKEIIHSLGLCALDLFVLRCSIDGLHRDSVLLEAEGDVGDAYSRRRNRNVYSLVLTDVHRGQRTQKQSTKFIVHPKKPSFEQRGLVLCMSRVFLFEKWQLLITALETYRLFKVDLVVAYVQSALLAVFKLMKAYERTGLLKVEPGIRFPHQRGMPWDPNAETEFNGQILLAHDCFYEYRESAQFIGLIDWDDLLVPSAHFATLPQAFAAAFAVRPDTAYFLVNKLEASFVEQPVTKPSEFSLRRMLRHGIRTAAMYNDEKMVVRPKALRGFWMHNSFNVEAMKRAVNMFTNYSILLHLANEERVNANEFQVPFMTKYDIDDMHSHATKLLKSLNKEFRVHRLPAAHPFYAALVACHSQIFAYYKSTGMNKSRCLSYSLCPLPKVPRAICAVTRSSFGTVLTRGAAKSVIHVRHRSEFGRDICADEGGI